MKVNVHMFAFNNHRNQIRVVNVPDDQLNLLNRPIDDIPSPLAHIPVDDVLDLVFKYGQNDFQPQPIYSVSVGDVIELNGRYHMVDLCGFQEIDKEEFESLKPPIGIEYLMNKGREKTSKRIREKIKGSKS